MATQRRRAICSARVPPAGAALATARRARGLRVPAGGRAAAPGARSRPCEALRSRHRCARRTTSFRAVNGTLADEDADPARQVELPSTFGVLREKTEAQLRASRRRDGAHARATPAGAHRRPWRAPSTRPRSRRARLGPLADELAAIDAMPSVDAALGATMGRRRPTRRRLAARGHTSRSTREHDQECPPGSAGRRAVAADRDHYLVATAPRRLAQARGACVVSPAAPARTLGRKRRRAATEADAVVALGDRRSRAAGCVSRAAIIRT